METSDTIVVPMHWMMWLVIGGVTVLLAVFVVLALVRLWGLRMQTKSRGCGGLDIEELRRQRDAGRISPEEYDAVRASLAGGAPVAEPALERPINLTDADDGDPERNRTDGQG